MASAIPNAGSTPNEGLEQPVQGPAAAPAHEGTKVRVVIWSDSHLTDRYGFPTFFDGELKQQKRFLPLVNNAYGGKLFNVDFFNQFKHSLERTEFGKASLHLIMLGGNNIRKAYRAGKFRTTAQREVNANSEIDRMVELYKELLAFSKTFPTIKVVLISPLPSKHVAHETFHERFSNLLELLATENNALFVNIRHLFLVPCEQNGCIANSELFRDDVHLNLDGTKLLAKKVYQPIQLLPSYPTFQTASKKFLRRQQYLLQVEKRQSEG